MPAGREPVELHLTASEVAALGDPVTAAKAHELGLRRIDVSPRRYFALFDRGAEIRGLLAGNGEPVDESGAFVTLALIEKALVMHVQDRLGRRELARRIPGLTDWYARLILKWFKVGEPDGLWLDAEDRAHAGAKLAPAPDGVWLPRS
jgi:hypothetical protein